MRLSGSKGAIIVLIAAVALLPLCNVSSLSPVSNQQRTTRREALVASTATGFGLLSLVDPPPASADPDLSQYQDGPEGLRYLVLEEGNGPKPERGQKIQTSYTLWINGFPGEPSSKKIDSSTKPILGDSPFKVRAGVSQVIRGWDLALMGMKEGEARRLVVPSSLGYGDKGVGPIPGKATLYFEMKLTKVEPMDELSDEAKKWLAEHPL